MIVNRNIGQAQDLALGHMIMGKALFSKWLEASGNIFVSTDYDLDADKHAVENEVVITEELRIQQILIREEEEVIWPWTLH